MQTARIVPSVNQIELHPWLQVSGRRVCEVRGGWWALDEGGGCLWLLLMYLG